MASENLKALDFLIGNWTAESTDAKGGKTLRTISYQWIFDQQFLVAESSRQAGNVAVAMRITYFWDPTKQQARAWVLSSDGAWNEACVEISSGSVRLHSKGVISTGQSVSGTSILMSTEPNSRTEQWEDMIVDGQALPAPPPINWQRVS